MSAQRSRLLWSLACAVAALVLLLCGWLMPIHLQAVDAAVIQNAGRNRVEKSAPDSSLIFAGNAGKLDLDAEPVTPYLIRNECVRNPLPYWAVRN